MLDQREFEKQILDVIASLKSAGYDPMAQLTGFLQTGDENFITRTGNARAIIRTLDSEQIAEYVDKNLKT